MSKTDRHQDIPWSPAQKIMALSIHGWGFLLLTSTLQNRDGSVIFIAFFAVVAVFIFGLGLRTISRHRALTSRNASRLDAARVIRSAIDQIANDQIDAAAIQLTIVAELLEQEPNQFDHQTWCGPVTADDMRSGGADD